MHIGLDGLAGHLGRGGEQRPDVHVESEIGEGGGDHLLAPVVAVLADLGHQDARAPPAPGRELVHPARTSIDLAGPGAVARTRVCRTSLRYTPSTALISAT